MVFFSTFHKMAVCSCFIVALWCSHDFIKAIESNAPLSSALLQLGLGVLNFSVVVDYIRKK